LRETGDEAAIYDPSTGTLFQLNATALAIWQACDGETTVDEITEALVTLTGLSSRNLRFDVDLAINALIDQGLLERE
jgi:hypothetical protein